MMFKKTLNQWFGLLVCVAIMLIVANYIKWAIQQESSTVESTVHDFGTPCWFMSSKIQRIIEDDLTMWTNHTIHNEEATMQEWFDLRIPELVALHSSTGLTTAEVVLCVHSLQRQ